MSSKNQKTISSLQMLQSSMKWHHMENKAASLWEAYTGMISYQSMILAINSSYVEPALQYEIQLQLIELSFKMVFSIPSFDEVKARGAGAEDTTDLVSLYQNILNIYEDTLLILVSKDLYKLQILKEMAVWMSEDRFYLQARGMVTISRVLSFASKKVRGYTSVDAPCLGVLAAELSLLCSHDDPSITHQASLGLYHLLCIAKCQSVEIEKNKTAKLADCGSGCHLSPPSEVDFLPKSLQQNRNKIAQSVGQTLLPSLLTDFVWSLLRKMSSSDYKTASEASSILNLTLEKYALKVTRVCKIVDAIYKQLYENCYHSMKQALLRIIALLACTSPKKVMFQLMDYPVPADNTLILMWQAAGSESSVAPQVLKTILLILKGKPGQMEENQLDRRRCSLDATSMMPVVASQVLCILLPVDSYRKAVTQFFPELLVSLMLQLFYSTQLRLEPEARPFSYALDALRVLLTCSGLQHVDMTLKKRNCWSQFSQPLYHHHWVYLIAKALSEHNFPQFPETLYYLYKLSVDGPRRSEDSIITTIFLTELLNNFFKDPFPEEFLVLYKNWINDSNPAVCKLSLQKIASMAPVINEIENVSSILLAILGAFHSKDKTVVARALFTLRKLLGRLDKMTYSTLCTQIASSYYPLMDHSNGGIRSMAIRHFGDLLNDMNRYMCLLSPVVLGALVPLVLFLEDVEKRVVKACRYTLEICASQLKWSTSYLKKDETYCFERVVLNICNNLLISYKSYVKDLISDTLGFLGSSRTYLKRAAIILTGYLAAMSDHLLFKNEIEVMFEAIERVRRDKDPEIQDLAEKTHGILKKIAHSMISSTIKQSFQKMVKNIYVKRLKPIYYYNWPQDETDSPADRETEKEGCMEENPEDFPDEAY
ncbi:maestro heat-like repeat-containing protein family member 9 isoform X1 [Ochotona princeps]|uniref:maestro heat-like repeat-containing protein family member 9 isoform X1 n=1 Tax=Ochotona princeps TaxID=9978 RepID=UPI002714B26A|nr:maestro heat-like repeat-containing protein family member 9 isoform X1 [Ochotona princeps]XP_058516945.1 maestro heat-like repeat-containing protein family member 9 isoform X1 [Ochotona princeps]